MIKRLFIDVDDTLILYKQPSDTHGELHPYGFWQGEPYEPNQNLIDAINKYSKENPTALIVIWSGGGKSYAQAAIDHFFPGSEYVAMDKGWDEFPLIRVGDIVVDDAVWSLGNHTFDVLDPVEGTKAIEGEL